MAADQEYSPAAVAFLRWTGRCSMLSTELLIRGVRTARGGPESNRACTVALVERVDQIANRLACRQGRGMSRSAVGSVAVFVVGACPVGGSAAEVRFLLDSNDYLHVALVHFRLPPGWVFLIHYTKCTILDGFCQVSEIDSGTRAR